METHMTSFDRASLNKLALSATLHCLTGCSIGEVAGMAAGAAAGLDTGITVALSVILAFASGYTLTLLPLRRAGIGVGTALKLAFASDTASIAVMETVDNAVMIFIPGAMDAGLTDARFWGSMALSLALAGAAAYPLVRWLIGRGRGHAVIHGLHGGDGEEAHHHHH